MHRRHVRTGWSMGRRGVLTLAIFLSSVLIAADAGPVAPVTGAQPSYGCLDLVSLTEVEQAFGLSGARLRSETRADAPDNLVPGQQNCHFELSGDVYLSVVAYSGEAMAAFEFSWRQSELAGAEPVAIGDGGLYQATFLSGPGWLVRIRGGGVSVSASDAEGLGRVDLNAATQRILGLVLERV